MAKSADHNIRKDRKKALSRNKKDSAASAAKRRQSAQLKGSSDHLLAAKSEDGAQTDSADDFGMDSKVLESPNQETSLNGDQLNPASSESDIAALITEYKAAMASGDSSTMSSLEGRIKSLLGLNASVDLPEYISTNLSSGPTPNEVGGTVNQWQSAIDRLRASAASNTATKQRISFPFNTSTPENSTYTQSTYTPTEADPDPVLSGSVTDGLISGATVFIDLDGDRVLDDNEIFTTTDAQGNYTLPYVNGTIVATGGTDIATGLANDTIFTAPAGYEYISPLTTVMQAMVDSGATAAEAEATVKAQYGLGDVNLKTTDPIGDLEGSNSDKALSILNKAVQTANVANQVAAMITGADNTITEADALTAAYAAIGTSINGGGNLNDLATLKSIITSCATSCGVDVTAFVNNAAAVMLDANNLLDNATGNGQAAMDAASALAKVAKLAQDTISAQIKAAVADNDAGKMADIETAYTGSNLVTEAGNTTAGDIDGDGQSDNSGTLNNSPTQTVVTGTVWGAATLDINNVFSAVDPEGNAITYYVTDNTGGNGTFSSTGTMDVTQFDALEFTGGVAGTVDSVTFSSEDSLGWKSADLTTTIYSSATSSSDGASNALVSIDANTLFSVTNDASNELTYWVKDDAGLGYFSQGGTNYNSGGWQNIGTSMAGLTYISGNPLDGTDEVQFKAVDAHGNESAVESSTVTVTNVAPIVSANQNSISVNANGTISIENLFSQTDFEGDEITEFWIKTDTDEASFSRTKNGKVYPVDADVWTKIFATWDGMAYHASNPTDGTEVISFRAVDSFGNVSNEVDVTVNVLNQAPVTTATGTLSTDADSSVDVSTVFSATDPEADAMTFYVNDDSSEGYFFLENGEKYTGDGWHEIDVDMTNLRYMAGNPSDLTDTLEFKAVDSFGNESVASIDVTTKNYAPVTSGDNSFFANLNTEVEVGRFFSAVDPEGDNFTYWVSDEEKTADGGYFIIDGVSKQGQNGWMKAGYSYDGVPDIVWVTGAPSDGSELFKIRAVDHGFGNEGNVINVNVDVNRAPTVTANQATISGDALQPIDISSLFTVSDIDGDDIQNYWIKTSSDKGFFSRTIYDVDADDWTSIQPRFDNLVYTPGNPNGGEETIYFRATDQYGAVSNEVAVTVDVYNYAPTTNGPTELYANENSTINLLDFFSVDDSDSSSITWWLADNSNNIDGSANNTGNGYVIVNGVSKEATGGWINLGTAPTSLVWNTNAGVNGQIQKFSLRGVDSQGKQGNASDVEITLQSSAPVVSWQTPNPQNALHANHGSEVIIANGTDTNLFSAIDAEGDNFTWWVNDYSTSDGYFVIDGVSKQGESGWMKAGYSYDGVPDIKWVTGNPSDGDEAFMIRAVDAGGAHSNAIKVDMNVSRDPVAEGETSIETNARTSLALGDYFKGTDPDGETLTYWVYDDSTDAAHGHVVVDGVSKAAESGWINAGTDISKIQWTTGNPVDGSESLQFKVADTYGNESNVIAADLTLTNQGPNISGPITFHANQGEVVDLSSLYSVIDPEGDAITYRVYDAAAISGNGGHFVINGTDQSSADGWFMVGSNFDDVQWVAGSPADGDEVFKIIATDAFDNTETLYVDVDVNRPAEATTNQLSITMDAYDTIDISTLFELVDPDGDTFSNFWFKTDDEAYISRTIYDVDCDDWTSIQPRFDNLTYTAGNNLSGEETLYFKATDEYGADSNEVAVTIHTVNHAPTINGPTSIVIAKDTVFNISDFFTAVDPEGQSIQKWIICDTSATADGNGYFTVNGVSKETTSGWIHVNGGMENTTWTTGNPSDGTELIKLRAVDAYGAMGPEHHIEINVVDQLPGNLDDPSDILNANNADGAALARTIDTATDVDWFALDLNANQSYVFQAEGVSTFGEGLTNPTLSLYYVDNSGNSNLLQRDISGGDGTNSWMAYEPTSAELSGGNFYLEVSSYDGGTGAYLISAAKDVDSSDNTLGLSGSNLNMWGSGQAAAINWEYSLFDFQVDKEWDWGFESTPLDFGAKPFLEFEASMGAELTINSGSMDFGQDINFDFDIASDVTAGSELVIDTSDWATSGMLDFTTNAPEFEFWAGMEVNASAGVNDIWMDTFWDDKYTYGDISFVDMTFSKTFLNIDSSGIEVLGESGEFEIEESFLGGIVEVEASIPEFGDTTISAQKGTNDRQWLSHTVINGEGDNFVSLGLDVDAFVGYIVPAADALEGEFDVDLGFLELDFEYTILDMNVNLNAKPVQEFRAALGYKEEDIDLNFTTYASQADKDAGNIFKVYSGDLGDIFELDTPDGLDGTMIVDVDFDIGGIVKNKSGLQLNAGPSLEVLNLEVDGEIFSIDFEASAGPMFEWEKTWNVGSPIWLWEETTHYDSLVSGSTTYTVDYHNRDDMFNLVVA